MTKVCFYFPYHEESGVPVLFLRIARWIAEKHGNEYKVYVCDFADGAMASNIKYDDKVELLISGGNDGIKVGNDDILIMQTLIPYYWPKELHLSPKAKVLYWTLHFRNLIPSLLPFPGLRKLPFENLSLFKFLSLFYGKFLHRITHMIEIMMINNGHYFMDKSTEQQTLEHLDIVIPENMEYLPVPASDYDGILKTNDNSDVIRACWLGRISFEKTPILVHTLEKCSKYALLNKKKIHFTIIGNGEYVEWVDDLDIDNDYFSKTKCAPIRFSELNEFLLSHVDIMFAMGTSALESAKLGIPTVLVDYTSSARPIKGDYIYSYIYERTGYDLAHLIGKKDLSRDNKSLDLIFNLLECNYDEVSKKCREHFVLNHSLSSVGDKFYQIISNLSFTYDMIDPKTIERPTLLKIYNKLRGFNRFD